MVTELGREIGYMERSERDLFKQQIYKHLKIKSLDEVTTMEDMSDKIEELYQLANTHYGYKRFKSDDTEGIVQFDN